MTVSLPSIAELHKIDVAHLNQKLKDELSHHLGVVYQPTSFGQKRTALFALYELCRSHKITNLNLSSTVNKMLCVILDCTPDELWQKVAEYQSARSNPRSPKHISAISFIEDVVTDIPEHSPLAKPINEFKILYQQSDDATQKNIASSLQDMWSTQLRQLGLSPKLSKKTTSKRKRQSSAVNFTPDKEFQVVSLITVLKELFHANIVTHAGKNTSYSDISSSSSTALPTQKAFAHNLKKNIKPLAAFQREKYRVFADSQSGKLWHWVSEGEGEKATLTLKPLDTQSSKAFDIDGEMLFIMDISGGMFAINSKDHPRVNLTSFSNAQPLLFAGTIKTNSEGKLTKLYACRDEYPTTERMLLKTIKHFSSLHLLDRNCIGHIGGVRHPLVARLLHDRFCEDFTLAKKRGLNVPAWPASNEMTPAAIQHRKQILRNLSSDPVNIGLFLTQQEHRQTILNHFPDDKKAQARTAATWLWKNPHHQSNIGIPAMIAPEDGLQSLEFPKELSDMSLGALLNTRLKQSPSNKNLNAEKTYQDLLQDILSSLGKYDVTTLQSHEFAPILLVEYEKGHCPTGPLSWAHIFIVEKLLSEHHSRQNLMENNAFKQKEAFWSTERIEWKRSFVANHPLLTLIIIIAVVSAIFTIATLLLVNLTPYAPTTAFAYLGHPIANNLAIDLSLTYFCSLLTSFALYFPYYFSHSYSGKSLAAKNYRVDPDEIAAKLGPNDQTKRQAHSKSRPITTTLLSQGATDPVKPVIKHQNNGAHNMQEFDLSQLANEDLFAFLNLPVDNLAPAMNQATSLPPALPPAPIQLPLPQPINTGLPVDYDEILPPAVYVPPNNEQQNAGAQELSLPAPLILPPAVNTFAIPSWPAFFTPTAPSQPNIIESRHGDTIYSLEKIGVLHDGTCGFYSLFCSSKEEVQKLYTPQFATHQQKAECTALRRSYRSRGVDILLAATAEQRELLIPDMIECYGDESDEFYKRDSEGVQTYIQAHEFEIRFSKFIRDLAPKFGIPTANLLEEDIYQLLVAKRDSEVNPELNEAFISLNKHRDNAHKAKGYLDGYVREKVIQDLHIECEYQHNGWLHLGAARLIARCLGKNLIVWAHNVGANTLTYHHENDSHRLPGLADQHICFRPGFWDIIKVVNTRPAAQQLPHTREATTEIITL